MGAPRSVRPARGAGLPRQTRVRARQVQRHLLYLYRRSGRAVQVATVAVSFVVQGLKKRAALGPVVVRAVAC